MPDNDTFHLNITWPGPGEKCPLCREFIEKDYSCRCVYCSKCERIFLSGEDKCECGTPKSQLTERQEMLHASLMHRIEGCLMQFLLNGAAEPTAPSLEFMTDRLRDTISKEVGYWIRHPRKS